MRRGVLSAVLAAGLLAGCHNEVPILAYHWIDAKTGLPWDESAGMFRAHMDELQRLGYTTITLRELADHLDGRRSLPARPVVITFDDGAASVYTDAFPALRERGMRAELFVIASVIGADAAHRQTWNPGVGAVDIPMLVWPEVAEMAASGTFSVGSHSMTHPSLAMISGDQVRWEVEQSRQNIEQALGIPVPFFAYPKNSFSAEVISAVHRAGYRGAVAGSGGVGGRYALWRLTVHSSDDLAELRRKLARTWADSW
jgi:peptidoglycan/xylan/chitin deacetylase (PgdA/CDA1 family)